MTSEFKLHSDEYFEEVLGTFEQAIQLDPTCSDAYFGKGAVLSLLGRTEESQKAYERALNLMRQSNNALIVSKLGSTTGESAQSEEVNPPPKRRHRRRADLSNLQFEVPDLPPKRRHRRRADLSNLQFEVPDLPPKRRHRRRFNFDPDTPEDSSEI